MYRAAIAGEAATAFCLRSAYLRNPQTEAATPGERFRHGFAYQEHTPRRQKTS
jgi:hypothetical protein